jgi:DtxR family manganese transport transcriptional regulator
VRSDHQAEIAADYVELIADLIEEENEARSSDAARWLGVTNATVVKTTRRLQDAGLATQLP